MSKDQKKTIELPVEIVDNLKEKIEWISSTIKFWHMDKLWPTNIIMDLCDNIYDELNLDNIQDYNFVSLSHIIDK